MEPTSLTAVIALITGLTTVASAAWGAWEHVRHGRVRQALIKTQEATAAVALAVEAIPMDESLRAKIKANAHDLSLLAGVDGELDLIVQEVTALAESIAAAQDGRVITVSTQRTALERFRARRDQQRARAISAPSGFAGIIIIGLLASGLAGCASTGVISGFEAKILDTGDPEQPKLLVVAFPPQSSTNVIEWDLYWDQDAAQGEGRMIVTTPWRSQE